MKDDIDKVSNKKKKAASAKKKSKKQESPTPTPPCTPPSSSNKTTEGSPDISGDEVKDDPPVLDKSKFASLGEKAQPGGWKDFINDPRLVKSKKLRDMLLTWCIYSDSVKVDDLILTGMFEMCTRTKRCCACIVCITTSTMHQKQAQKNTHTKRYWSTKILAQADASARANALFINRFQLLLDIYFHRSRVELRIRKLK